MFVSNGNLAFTPELSQRDWVLISAALSGYGHNADYQDLVERLDKQMQAATSPKTTTSRK